MAEYTGEIVPDKEAQEKFIRENAMKARGAPPPPPAKAVDPQVETKKNGFISKWLRRNEDAFNTK